MEQVTLEEAVAILSRILKDYRALDKLEQAIKDVLDLQRVRTETEVTLKLVEASLAEREEELASVSETLSTKRAEAVLEIASLQERLDVLRIEAASSERAHAEALLRMASQEAERRAEIELAHSERGAQLALELQEHEDRLASLKAGIEEFKRAHGL